MSEITTNERRDFELNMEVRASENEPTKIVGYAAVFNKLSQDFGGWQEQIAPGAFARAIKEDDVRALVDHEPSKVIGRSKSGTLKMAEDNVGLLVEISPPDTQVGRDIVTSIRRGDVTGMSFGFRVNKEAWEFSKDGNDIRTLQDVSLFDVSPVTYPAYPDTTVGLRSYKDFLERSGGEEAGEEKREETAPDCWELKAKLKLIKAKAESKDCPILDSNGEKV